MSNLFWHPTSGDQYITTTSSTDDTLLISNNVPPVFDGSDGVRAPGESTVSGFYGLSSIYFEFDLSALDDTTGNNNTLLASFNVGFANEDYNWATGGNLNVLGELAGTFAWRPGDGDVVTENTYTSYGAAITGPMTGAVAVSSTGEVWFASSITTGTTNWVNDADPSTGLGYAFTLSSSPTTYVFGAFCDGTARMPQILIHNEDNLGGTIPTDFLYADTSGADAPSVPDGLSPIPSGIVDIRVPVLEPYEQLEGIDRIVYLHPASGSDSNDGLTEDAAKATISGAYSALRTGYADHVVIFAGQNLNGQKLDIDSVSEERVGRSRKQRLMIRSSDDTSSIEWNNTNAEGTPIIINGAPSWTSGLQNFEFRNLDISRGAESDRSLAMRELDVVIAYDNNADLISNIFFQKCRFRDATDSIRFQNDDIDRGKHCGPFYFNQNVLANKSRDPNPDPGAHYSGFYIKDCEVHFNGHISLVVGDLGDNGGYLGHHLYYQAQDYHEYLPPTIHHLLEVSGPSTDTIRRSADYRFGVYVNNPGGPMLTYNYINTASGINSALSAFPDGIVEGKIRDVLITHGRNHLGSGTEATGANEHRGWGVFFEGVDTTNLVAGDILSLDFSGHRWLTLGPNFGTGKYVSFNSPENQRRYYATDIRDVRSWKWDGQMSLDGLGVLLSGLEEYPSRYINGVHIFHPDQVDPSGPTVNFASVPDDLMPCSTYFENAELWWGEVSSVSGIIESGGRQYDITGFSTLSGTNNLNYASSGWATSGELLEGGLDLYAQNYLLNTDSTWEDLLPYWSGMHEVWIPEISPAGIQIYFAQHAGQVTPPEFSSVTDNLDGTVTLGWFGAYNATGFDIQYRVSGVDEWSTASSIPDGSLQEFTFAVPASGEYEFRAISYGIYEDPSEGLETYSFGVSGETLSSLSWYGPQVELVSAIDASSFYIQFSPSGTGYTEFHIQHSPDAVTWDYISSSIPEEEAEFFTNTVSAYEEGSFIWFRMRSSDGVTPSEFGNELSGVTFPYPPSNFTITRTTLGYRLEWDDNSNVEAHYIVLKNGVTLAVLPPDTTSYDDNT